MSETIWVDEAISQEPASNFAVESLMHLASELLYDKHCIELACYSYDYNGSMATFTTATRSDAYENESNIAELEIGPEDIDEPTLRIRFGDDNMLLDFDYGEQGTESLMTALLHIENLISNPKLTGPAREVMTRLKEVCPHIGRAAFAEDIIDLCVRAGRSAGEILPTAAVIRQVVDHNTYARTQTTIYERNYSDGRKIEIIKTKVIGNIALETSIPEWQIEYSDPTTNCNRYFIVEDGTPYLDVEQLDRMAEDHATIPAEELRLIAELREELGRPEPMTNDVLALGKAIKDAIYLEATSQTKPRKLNAYAHLSAVYGS